MDSHDSQSDDYPLCFSHMIKWQIKAQRIHLIRRFFAV